MHLLVLHVIGIVTLLCDRVFCHQDKTRQCAASGTATQSYTLTLRGSGAGRYPRRLAQSLSSHGTVAATPRKRLVRPGASGDNWYRGSAVWVHRPSSVSRAAFIGVELTEVVSQQTHTDVREGGCYD